MNPAAPTQDVSKQVELMNRARIDQGITGGRPVKFNNVAALDKAINDYFESTDYPTITGLAVALDTNRKTLIDTSQRPEFFNSIKRAVERCEAFVEQAAMMGKANATMAIFTLKNNYGWREQTESLNVNVDANTTHSEASQATATQFADYLKQSTVSQPDQAALPAQTEQNTP